MRTLKFDGGYVEQPEFHGGRYCFNGSFPESAKHWYAVQWKMLTGRLKYKGNKARNALRRLKIHWTEKSLQETGIL